MKAELQYDVEDILWRKILFVDDSYTHPKWVAPLSEEANYMTPLSLHCFQNLTSGVKQIAEFFGFSPAAEQIQSIVDRAAFQAMKDKAQETHGAVGSVLFRKGKFVYSKQTAYFARLVNGSTAVWADRNLDQ